MSENIKFTYLYRDAANYKIWNDIVFANPFRVSVEEIESRLRRNFEGEELFVADQIRLPELFPYLSGSVNDNDHCYHEFESVEITTERPNDVHGRSIRRFVEEVENKARSGWQVFDPRERVK